MIVPDTPSSLASQLPHWLFAVLKFVPLLTPQAL
jgi:hypothetical protein